MTGKDFSEIVLGKNWKLWVNKVRLIKYKELQIGGHASSGSTFKISES